RLAELDAARSARLRAFQRSRTTFLSRIYQLAYENLYLLDPVVSVHPDELSLEAFSRDESTYARVAAKHDLFHRVQELQCGTTNIDFSTGLHTEVERLRSYRQTSFTVDPGGVTVSTDGGEHREKKIDLPESWVMGFLQLLARLIPLTRRIDVFLAGHGLPAIYVLDLGPLTFTLALSGWTDNDWTGGAKFDLLARRLAVSTADLATTYEMLRRQHFGTE